MKKLIYLNGVAPYPTAELHAAQKDDLENAESFRIVVNAYRNRFTHFNPFGRPLTYLYERKRAESVAQFLEAAPNPIRRASKNFVNAEIEARLEIGVMSSLASHLRITKYEDLKRSWRTVHKNCLENSKRLFNSFCEELEDFDQLLLYNGRFCEDSAARLAAEHLGKSYKVYDFKKAGSYYEFVDVPLHSVAENCKRAKTYFIEDKKRGNAVAREFMKLKLAGKHTYEKSYTSNHKEGQLRGLLKPKKKIVGIFPSSDDEYRFLGNDWGVEIVDSQSQEIQKLATVLGDDFQIIVRMHPNMIDMQKSAYMEYLELEQCSNITVVTADSSISSYELLYRADIVVGFCSTILAEANFERKKVIGIGGNPYFNLPIFNKAKDGKEAALFISNNTLKLKSKTASAIWINYLWKYSEKNRYIKATSTSSNNVRGEEFLFKLKNVHLFRLLAAFDRLEVKLRKNSSWNTTLLHESFISVKDILFNKSSNKFMNVE